MSVTSYISGLWRAITGRSLENPRTPLDPWHDAAGGKGLEGDLSGAGVRVNRQKALTVAAVWRAVNLIADGVAKLPLGVYRADGDNRRSDPTHPAHRLLRVQPNAYMTAFTFKQVLSAHVLLEGNAYAYISRAASGRPLDLVILHPSRTEPVIHNKELWYIHELRSGEERKLPAADVVHLKGLGHDGLKGYSVLSYARESLGLAIASTVYGGTFFRNNARPGVLLRHPSKLSPEARKNLRESWERLHTGLDNAHKTAILEEGADAVVTQINARDSQLIESKQFSLIDVANWFGVPANKLGANTNTSYGSLEQDNQDFLDHTIDARLVMWEEELEMKLLRSEERDEFSHCISFDRMSLQRADMDKRANYYQKAVTTGWMSFDEVRGREGMNPSEGGVGKSYARPLNLAFVGGDAKAGDASRALIDLPDIRQAQAWDCGAAVVASTLSYFEREPSTLAAAITALGTTPEAGTSPAAVLALLARVGLAASAASSLGVEDLARFHAAGQVVLCPVRVAGSGHWVAVIGVGFGQVIIQDPACGRRLVPQEEWLAGWADSDTSGNAYERFGIAVGATLPTAPTDDDDDDDEVKGDGENDDPSTSEGKE